MSIDDLNCRGGMVALVEPELSPELHVAISRCDRHSAMATASSTAMVPPWPIKGVKLFKGLSKRDPLQQEVRHRDRMIGRNRDVQSS